MGTAFAVGIVLAILWFLEKILGTPMVIRPIVVSAAIGLALGDVVTGVTIGAALELIFMGAIQIGGAVPPDVLVGAGLGTAFAIITNQGSEIALTLALPIAILAQSLKVIVFIVRSWFMDLAVKMARQANVKGLYALNIGGLLLQCLMYFVVGYVAIIFGSSAVEAFVSSIPQVIMKGLQVAGGLLPAVGFALLLQPMMEGKNIIYFVLGFILLSYMNLPILAITLFGVILAFIIINESNTSVEVVKQADDMEGLFDE